MKGIEKEIYPYVLKAEKELLPNERTVWHLKVITAYESSASLRRYSKSFRQNRDQSEVIESAYRHAYRSEWLDVVKKVENYQFGYLNPELQEKGYMTFDEQELIAKVFEELPDAYVREIIEAAKGEVFVEEADRKK